MAQACINPALLERSVKLMITHQFFKHGAIRCLIQPGNVLYSLSNSFKCKNLSVLTVKGNGTGRDEVMWEPTTMCCTGDTHSPIPLYSFTSTYCKLPLLHHTWDKQWFTKGSAQFIHPMRGPTTLYPLSHCILTVLEPYKAKYDILTNSTFQRGNNLKKKDFFRRLWLSLYNSGFPRQCNHRDEHLLQC